MIQHLANVSGGKDSTAVYLLAIESGRPFRAVFADTGNEHQAVYDYIADLPRLTGGPPIETVRADFTAQLARHRAYILAKWPAELVAGRQGRWLFAGRARFVIDENDEGGFTEEVAMGPASAEPPIGDPFAAARAPVRDLNGTWVWKPGVPPLTPEAADSIVQEAAALNTPTGNPYLDLCVLKGRFPSRMAQFCTGELKEIPITTQVVLPMLKAGPVLQWLGIRADESRNRAKQPRYNRHDSGSTLWRPIFHWKVEDVWAKHHEHGIKPNPLYAMGMGRVGCMPCINCRKSELRTIAQQFPEHIDRVERWEVIVAKASKRGGANFFAPGDPALAGTADFGSIRSAAEWSLTTRGGRQFGMFMDQQTGGGCSSDLGLCETEAA